MSGNMSRTSSSGDEITITCLFLGHSPSKAFAIDIRNSKAISSLKQEIAKKRPDLIGNIIPDELDLFYGNISTVQETDKQGKIKYKSDNQITAAIQEFMKTNPEPERGFMELDTFLPLGVKCIHFVFRIPDNAPVSHAMVKDGSGPSSGASGSKHSHSGDIDMGMGLTSSGVVRTRVEEEEVTDQLRPLAKKAKRKVDHTSKLLARWRQPIAVPEVVTLLGHLRTPLSEEEKVPISQAEFDHLVTIYNPDSPKSELRAEKVAALFRVTDDEEAHSILVTFESALAWSPPASGTESAFHAIWDNNISRIIGTVLFDGNFIRDSYQNTNTALKRPDYGFLIKKYCLFRGEEKPPDSSDNPKQELIEKLVDFPYQPLKFILGYYAFGTDVNYVAITHPPVTAEPLIAHNLELKAERLDNLVHIIRLCSALSWMSEQLAPRSNPEFIAIERPGGVEVTIGAVVKKHFKNHGALDHVLHLNAIYGLLKEKKVPNTDELVEIVFNGDPYIMTKPVGVDRPPRTGVELFQAAISVLQALKVMHAGPEPVYHRDIRRPNILKRQDQEGWFLIDWSDASTTPTKASMMLQKESHSPRVFKDNHGGEVDIWGVGLYLHDSLSCCNPPRPKEIIGMAKRWMTDGTVTAAVALEELERSQHLFQ